VIDFLDVITCYLLENLVWLAI